MHQGQSCDVAGACDVVPCCALDEQLPVCSADDLPFCDSDDKLLMRTGGVAVVQRRFQQKSAAAQRQQDAAMAKFDAHRRRTQASQIINAAHVKTLETPHTLLGPNEHLTKACCELATLVHATTVAVYDPLRQD